MSDLKKAAQQFVADYENGDLGDLKHYARSLRSALAQQEHVIRGLHSITTAHDGMQLLYRIHERPDWIAPEAGREHHKDWHQLLTHPDARLIAAAPELLEALKDMGARYGLTEQARAAIARAEGEKS